MNEGIQDIYRYILKCGRPVKVVPMINNEYLIIIGWKFSGRRESLGNIDTGYAKFILTPTGARRM